MKLRHIFALLFALLVFVSCVGAPENSVETVGQVTKSMTGENVEIVIENGKAVVKGYFENAGFSEDEYVVEFTVVKDDDEASSIVREKKYKLSEGENSFEQGFTITTKKMFVKAKVTLGDETVIGEAERTINTLRLLSIGNSFSVDAQEHLYGIAQDMGFDNIILGNLYFGGCSLQGHYGYMVNNKASYTYYKNTTGAWTQKENATMYEGLTDEDWDYITLQQASGASGMSDTYEPYLSKLVQYVNDNKTNDKAELVWHMTWAYSGDSTHQDFVKYDNDQMKMYEGIVNAVKENIADNKDFALVIPSGTAIQNARMSALGDTLCRDGFHLELGYGRYLAGLTWMHTITGLPIDDVSFIPNNMFDEETLSILKECAKNAAIKPFEVSY